MREGDFTTRHSMKPEGDDPESTEFSGISEKGVILAKEKGREILKDLEEAEEGTIMFISGISEAIRTRSTAEVYGQEMKKTISEEAKEDIIVLLPEDLPKDLKKRKKHYIASSVEFLSEKIKENPDKKIVVDFPLFIKEFSLEGRWINDSGEMTEYTKELLERNNNDGDESLRDWFDNEGKIGDLEGPNPTEVAEQQLAGIERLRKFAKKYIPSERPLIIGSIGHSWNLDAMAVYLANNGEVSREAFDEMKAKMIGETKLIRIVDHKGKQALEYGDLLIPLEG